MTQQVLINAAREGSRACIVGGLNVDDTEEIVEEYSKNNNIEGVEVSVTPNPLAAEIGDPITVTVEIDYSEVSFFAPRFLTKNARLTAQSTMRKEREN